MKLIYIVNQRLPIEKAYGLQIAKMAEAFADCGLEVNLISPTRRDPIKQDFFSFYSIKRNFKFKKLFSPDFYFPGKLDKVAVAVKSLVSASVLALYSVFRKADFIYSRDELPLYFLSFFKKSLIFEIHRFSKKRSFFYRRFRNKNFKVVSISKGLKDELLNFGFKPENILVAPDGVDLEEFNLNLSKSEARIKFGLPLDKKIAVYAGHLFKWKGVDTLLKAALLLKEVLFVFIGGTEKDVENFKLLIEKYRAENVMLLGHRPYSEIPFYLKAADVLVLPNEKEEKISEFYTSPLKLFEYMASGRPIVASNLPSVREILDKDSGLFFESGSSQRLIEAIKRVIEDENLTKSLSAKAFEKIHQYTWDKRARKILSFINVQRQ